MTGFSRVQTRELTNSPCLYGVVNGTAAANKALVLDANKDITGIRNLTITGTLVAPTQAETDATFSIVDDGDATKVVKFQVSGNTTGITTTIASQSTGAATITLPAATSTLATIGGTETLTAKTLTNPVVNGPVAVAVGSSLTINATSHVGSVIKLDTAGGSTATLPAATGTGNKYLFLVTVSTTSAAHKILAASSSDNILGSAAGYTGAGGATKNFAAAPASTYHSIQMPNSGSQPSGGILGDWFEFIDVATNLWYCRAVYQAGTTPTTPFSTATS